MIAYVENGSSLIRFSSGDNLPERAFVLAVGGFLSLPQAVFATARRDGDSWHVPCVAEALAAAEPFHAYAMILKFAEALKDVLHVERASIESVPIEIDEIHVTSADVRFRAKGSARFVRMPRGRLSAKDWSDAVRIRLEQTQEMGAFGISAHDIDRICTAILTSEDQLEPAGGAA